MKRSWLLLLLFTVVLSAQNSAKTCATAERVYQLLQREHYRPKVLDDSLSVFVFDSFIDQLDPNHSLFLKSEIEQLSLHRFTIDNNLLNGNCAFMDDFASAYKRALERKRHIIQEIAESPLHYNSADSIRFSKKNFPFDTDVAQLEYLWRKRIIFEVLQDVSKSSSNLDSLMLVFPTLEKEARRRTLETNLCKVNSILENQEDFETNLRNNFLNIFCTWFDPHSNYFSSDAKSSFMSALSTRNLSLGFYASVNENEEIVVDEIIPGGPAAQSQKLEKDDIIVKVTNSHGQEFPVSCSSLETIGELIFSDASVQICLTVRKKNGTLLDIGLVKQIMKADDTRVYSFVAEKGTKVGYLCIPAFYTDFNGDDAVGCAADVQKEILKLQQENIDGLVIDLQENGGGSMDEAIRLAGLFTDGGPVSILSDRHNKHTVLRDPEKSTAYDGPLVVMVDGNSASASEFFTAAIQDYKRAVVIGAPTLGKATMQSIMPLDNKHPDDFVKVTVQKFYRITGGSSQIDGVVPDVRLPVLFDSLIPREKSYKTALPHDSIAVKARFLKYFPQVIAQASEMSRRRIRSNPLFTEMDQLNRDINRLYHEDKKPVRLTLPDVFTEIHSVDTIWKKVKEISDRPNGCIVRNTASDQLQLKLDPSLVELNDFKLKDVASNPQLAEAIAIIADLRKLMP